MTKRSEPKVTLNITPGELTPAHLQSGTRSGLGRLRFTVLTNNSLRYLRVVRWL